ncbi:MAG: HlyC/CorC family transporter [Chloroflexi bacterium]|nr:MAG: HlyC/CorC family transporter [Chloroflexota bacterium]
MVTSILIVAAVVILLILINALYVAGEFAAVSARRPRLAQLADEGNRTAQYMLNLVETPHHLDTYIAACQLGITLSSLVLGFYGQSQIITLFAPRLGTLDAATQAAVGSILSTVILLTLTILQVILGELMPKNVALQYPERLALLTAPIMRWSVALFRPLIWLFNGSGQFLLRLMGREVVAEQAHLHSPEEILILVEESGAGGVLDAEERRLLVNTLQLRNLTARRVMIPRNHMLAAPVDKPCDELFRILATSPYTRLPLFDTTIDTIVGVVHLKDLMQSYWRQQRSAGAAPCNVREIMRGVLHVPDSALVEEVMETMQRQRYNMAVVVDEYGGTAGMITFEDLVEEIIGEFQDEFDVENPPLELRPNNRLRVRGDVLLDDLNEVLTFPLPTDDINTIGGLVLATLGRIPRAGDIAQVGDLPIRVDRVVNNSIVAVSFPVQAEQAARLREIAKEL